MSKRLLVLFFLICYMLFFFWAQVKPLPDGVSFAGDVHYISNESISFLGDLTYTVNDSRVYDHVLFDSIFQSISQAEEFVVVDMFLFTAEQYNNSELIPLADLLSEALINRLVQVPDLQVVFITDHFNTLYGSAIPPHIARLSDAGVDVVYTDMSKLRHSNMFYGPLWDMSFRVFGLPAYDANVIPNVLFATPDHIGVRSFFTLLNFRANHRKVVLTESSAHVVSANPHIGSSLHSNVGVRLNDSRVISDLLRSEQSVIDFSSYDISLPSVSSSFSDGSVGVQVVTEEKIRDVVLSEINSASSGDSLDIAMFYFSDRKIVSALKRASSRGVLVSVLLDPNKDAFGREKSGVPNRQVAWELHRAGINVSWYDTRGEQYHSKLFVKRSGSDVVVILGSANYTKRNLNDYNLETNVVVYASSSDVFSSDVLSYLSHSKQYSLPYAAYADHSVFRYVQYRFMEWSGFSSF